MKTKQLSDLYNFCAIVKAGSLQAASDKLDIPAPTLSRRLKKLEQQLGYKLLNRNAHHLQLTTDGETYYNQLAPSFENLHDKINSLNNKDDDLEGDIILFVPIGMLRVFMNAWIVEFLKQWPKVNIIIKDANSIVDMENNKVDLAIKFLPEGPSDWTAVKIFITEKWVVATPEYLKNVEKPANFTALKQHNIIMNKDAMTWRFSKNGKGLNFNHKPRFLPPSIFDALEAVELGLGIGYIPRTLVDDAVKQGRLVKLMPDYTQESAIGYLLYANRSVLSKRVRVFIEFLQNKSKLVI